MLWTFCSPVPRVAQFELWHEIKGGRDHVTALPLSKISSSTSISESIRFLLPTLTMPVDLAKLEAHLAGKSYVEG
jgi:hypothetical protein